MGGNYFKNWTNEMVEEFNRRKLKGRLLSASNEAKILTETSKHYPTLLKPSDFKDAFPGAKKKRIRQSGKPLLNNLEASWLLNLRSLAPKATFYPQAITLRLCNGCRYTPDIISADYVSEGMMAWELKGKKVWDDSIVKLKFAAKEFPFIKFVLVWKENGQWVTQEILP